PLIAAAGPAAPFVAAGAAAVALFTHVFGGGCGHACIDAAKIEQIYEAAADNLLAVGKLGMISRAEAVGGMQMLMQAGQQHEAQLNDSQAQKGAANLSKVVAAEINAANSLPEAARVPLDLNRARSVYMSGHGWYPDSLSAAAQWTDQYLAGLASNPVRAVAQTASEALTVSGGDVPSLVIVGLGIVVLFFLFR